MYYLLLLRTYTTAESVWWTRRVNQARYQCHGVRSAQHTAAPGVFSAVAAMAEQKTNPPEQGYTILLQAAAANNTDKAV